jgi:transcriptional regulator with XRE-family HTH domain
VTTVGSHIRDRRLAAGISLRELASRLNTTHVSLGAIERGKAEVGPAMVERLVEHLPGFDVSLLRGTIAAEPCKSWVWLPRMRALVRKTGEAWTVLDVKADMLHAIRVGDFGGHSSTVWSRDFDPDLHDAATTGLIEHVLLPAAWAEHTIEVRRHTMCHEVFIREWSSGWVPGHAVGQTLFHALEAAP